MEPIEPGRDAVRAERAGGSVPARAGRGAYRQQTLMVADAAGFEVLRATAPGAENLARRMDRIAANATMGRFVWADARLLTPGHKLGNLVPAGKQAQPGGGVAGASEESGPTSWFARSGLARFRQWLRKAAPWLAALASAGIGYQIFLQRTL